MLSRAEDMYEQQQQQQCHWPYADTSPVAGNALPCKPVLMRLCVLMPILHMAVP